MFLHVFISVMEYIGGGFCSAFVFLPEGEYPPHLEASNALYSADRIQECLLRCIAASGTEIDGKIIGNEAFFIKKQDKTCACSENKCTTPAPRVYYESYSIVKSNINIL